MGPDIFRDLEFQRRQPGYLGQCIAAAFGDADRSSRSAHVVALPSKGDKT